MKRILKYMGIIFLGIIPNIVFGQVSFEAITDAREIFEGNYIEVKFTLKNASGKNFQLPSLDDFEILSGPSRSVSTTIINGRRSQELSYTYLFTPKRIGDLVLGSATIEADNQVLKTRPISVKVLKSSEQVASDGDAEYFVKAEVAQKEVFVGQQVKLQYKLYTRINIDNINVLKESEYPGFYVSELLKFDSQVKREIINGMQYYTKVLKQVALFPQQAGQLVVEPMQLQLGIADERGRSPFGSFFYSQPLKRISVATNKIEVTAKSLPSNIPNDFVGAVGSYKFKATVNQTDLSTDDLIVLKVTIDGTGDIKRITAPEFEFPSEFEVYPPKITEDNSLEINGNIYGKKVIEYLFLPRHPGSYEINPSISYFDPSQGAYIQKKDGPIIFEIKPGINYQKSLAEISIPDDTENNKKKLAIKPIKTNIQANREGILVWGSPAFYLVGFSPFLALLLLIMYKFSAANASKENGAGLKKRKARQMAEKRLSEAKEHLKKGEGHLFYKSITNAMLGYLADKLGMTKMALNREQIGVKLLEMGLVKEQVNVFIGILNTSESALYAGLNQTEAMKSVYDNTADIIAQIEILAKDYYRA
jgi:hypothetical protein